MNDLGKLIIGVSCAVKTKKGENNPRLFNSDSIQVGFVLYILTIHREYYKLLDVKNNMIILFLLPKNLHCLKSDATFLDDNLTFRRLIPTLYHRKIIHPFKKYFTFEVITLVIEMNLL